MQLEKNVHGENVELFGIVALSYMEIFPSY